MDIQILYKPAYSMGVLKLTPNERVRVEGGSMVGMSQGITLETQATGGVLKSLARSMLGGESFFQNVYQAPAAGGEVMVAPSLPGDLYALDLNNMTILIQSGSYVASEEGVAVDTKWGGAKTFFASEGFIMLKASGQGKILMSSYGAIHEVALAAGQVFTVDTGHLVAFTESLGFNVRRIGGIKSTLFSGEGLVVDLTGPGRLLMQTRSASSFLSWLLPKLPKSNSSS